MTTIYGDKENIYSYSGAMQNVSMWNAITNFLRNSRAKCLADKNGVFYETADGKLYELFK